MTRSATLTNLVLWVLLVGLCGCYEIKDQLTLEPDGSGTIRLEVQTSVNPEEFGMLWSMMGTGNETKHPALYPPLSQTEATAYFPAPGFEVEVDEQGPEENGRKVVITAAFKDLRTLLASPYAHDHQLALSIDGSKFTLRAKSALEPVARAAAIPLDREIRDMLSPSLLEARKKTNGVHAEFRVTLPNDPTASTTTIEGKTAGWVFDRAKSGSHEAFLRDTTAVLEVSCSTEKLEFALTPHPRLGLLPFGQLQESTVASEPIDARKVLASARFEPRTLLVTRTMNFSGNAPPDSSSLLNGIVIVPLEFTPARWGLPNLLVAEDASGQNLIFAASDDDFDVTFNSRSWRTSHIDTEPGGDPPGTDTTFEVRREVALSFRAPEWGVKELRTIKASIAMHYPGPGQIIKLTNAIPAAWIIQASEGARRSFYNADEETGHMIRDARLSATGGGLRVQNAYRASGITTLVLQLESRDSNFQGGQVFDAEGQPWFTVCSLHAETEAASCWLVVPGNPKPPLSMALRLARGGPTIDIPIELQHVPIDRN